MDFGEVLRRRRMIRNYRADPVDRAVVERIVARARKVPSAGHAQGHYLVVVSEQERRRAIARLADEDRFVAQGYPPWISTAPVHVVVCTRAEDYYERYREPDKLAAEGTEVDWPIPYWYVDAGACLMLVLLAAVDEGLGAGFFGVRGLVGLKELLGIPDDVTPVGIVTIGQADKEQPAGSARRGWKPLEEVVRWEHW